MKLSIYARQVGVTYKTVYRWWKAGKLDVYQLDTGTVIVRDPIPVQATNVAFMRVCLRSIRKVTWNG